jgi:YHS domain-containing protein
MAMTRLAFILLAAAAMAKSPVDPVNKDGGGSAVKGYDVVAYFTESKPVKGSPQFTANWMGAKYQFASVENKQAFEKDPEKYAPRFGGYCAWAVGHGYTADADPQAWKIVDGKLYLNYNRDVQKKWSADQGKWIAEAEKNWPGLHK